MTSEMVPFTATLTFDEGTLSGTGWLVLHKSNASGLPENDDTLTLPIRYE